VAKIARITYGLVSNHPFFDGNKRIGTYVMMVLLELNNIEADFSDDEIVDIGLRLAGGTMNDGKLIKLILMAENKRQAEK
jgi:death-on-curing protein